MKTIIRTALILFLICSLSAGLCGVINSITAPKIAENTAKAEKEALMAVANGYEMGEAMDSGDTQITLMIPLMKDGKTEGYIFRIGTNGYGGSMNVIASFRTNGEIMKAKLMENGETPGLGKKAEKESYMAMFYGTGTDGNPVPRSKSAMSAADAEVVSGASITFNGVTGALERGSYFAREKGEEL